MKFTKLVVLSSLIAYAFISCDKKARVLNRPVAKPDTSHAIGKNPDGGIVFYLDSTGLHGMAAATGDLNMAAPWGCAGSVQTAFGTARGTGELNTTAILNGCTDADIAARMCDEFVSGGHSDWYMPSKDELDLMYTNLYKGGFGGFSTGYYWSSTEEDANSAWFQFFDGNGVQARYNKSYAFFVRPIRVF